MANPLIKIKAQVGAFGQSVKVFYSVNKGFVLGGITILSILLIVWARLGFTFEIGRFFAAELPPPAILTVQCSASQAVLSWNVPVGSTANSIQKNVNGAGWQFVYQEQAPPYTVTTFTDTFTPTTVYRHKSDPNVVSNLVQCPPAGSPTPTPTVSPTATSSPAACPATSPTLLSASQITTTSAVLVWSPGAAGAFQQLRVGSNLAEVNTGCPAPTTCAVVEHNLPATQSNYTIPTGRLSPNTTYYWRVVTFNAATCYRDAVGNFVTAAAIPSPTPTPTPTPSPTATTLPPAPSGCFYQEVQCVTTPCDPVLVCPSPTPTSTPLPSATLSMNVVGANMTTSPGTYSSIVTAAPNQEITVRSVVANNIDPTTTSGGVAGSAVTVRASLPQGLIYVAGSTQLNGNSVSADTVTGSGLAVGSLGAGQTATVDFRARVNGASFPIGQSQAGVTVQAQATGGMTVSGTVTVIVNRAGVAQPGTVQTGPGDAVVAAMLISAILTLLYVSYTHTSVFRRREVQTIARTRDPLDFRS